MQARESESQRSLLEAWAGWISQSAELLGRALPSSTTTDLDPRIDLRHRHKALLERAVHAFEVREVQLETNSNLKRIMHPVLI